MKTTTTKDTALSDYVEMIKNSWTYQRMTENEKNQVFDCLTFPGISGTAAQRWNQLHAIYNAFLTGIGYSGPKWREPNPEKIPF